MDNRPSLTVQARSRLEDLPEWRRPGAAGRSRQPSEKRPHAAGVVLASGAGSRFGAAQNKAYLPLAGRSLVSWALCALATAPEVGPLILVIRQEDQRQAERVLHREVDGRDVELICGGATRQESELNALRHLAGRIDAEIVDVVVFHDAARPLATANLAEAVIHEARRHGGAIPGIPADDLAEVDSAGQLTGGLLTGLIRAQTPQAFAASAVLEAHEAAARAGFAGTDTSSCVERFGGLAVRWILGEPHNIKITHPEDLFVAEQLLVGRGFRLT